MDVGILELNRNPENYFAEVEQAAFDPSNTVPGISFSPDKMLQARIFSYSDAHRYRLGVNYQRLPINRPKGIDPRTYHRDGTMRFDGNEGSAVNYEPNSFGGPKQNPAYKEPPLKINGNADRYNQPITDDDFVQPGNLYRLMPPDEQARLVENIVNTMKGVPVEIQKRQLAHFKRADAKWGERVAKGLGL
jgi:catalase